MSHKTLRRFHGYDYSRGGSMFVTTGLAARKPLFGRVDHARVVLSAAGKITQKDLLEAAPSRSELIGLNFTAAELARAAGGKAIYAQWVGGRVIYAAPLAIGGTFCV